MATVEQVPPLVPGDFLTREEFFRRWEAHPKIKKAELIGGIVYMPSPLSVDHGDMDNDLGGWLFTYKIATPGCACGHNTTSILLEDSPQPDINLRLLPEYGGTSWVDEDDGFLHGVPELFVEVCRSSAAYDLHQKFNLYQAAGVPEYLAVLLYEKEIRWHRLVNKVYQIMQPDSQGIWRSQKFPGLWLDGPALLTGNMNHVLAKLQEGIQSAEHQAFVDQLARNKK
jgi:Uma2 family endonuclease